MPFLSPSSPNKSTPASRRAATIRSWQMSRRMEESPQSRGISSISDKIKTTTFQKRGDQVVRGVAGKTNTGTAGSIKDLLSRGSRSMPTSPKPLGGGINSNFRPIK